MNPFLKLNKDALHHAYIVEGNPSSARAAVLDFLKNAFEMDLGHSDVFVLDWPDFGIEDAQEIIDINSRKPVRGTRKMVVVSLSSVSHQAQNSLLKVLEEPRPGTVFFILTQVSSMFLPTVLSRVHVLRGDFGDFSDAASGATDPVSLISNNKKSDKATAAADKKRDAIVATLSPENFLTSDKAERIALAKKIADMKSDEKIGDAEIFTFVQGLEKLAHSRSKEGSSARTAVAKAFTKVDEYIRDASSSKKMLLEYLAMTLPEA